MFIRILSCTILSAVLLTAADAPGDAAWKNLLTLAGKWERTEGGKKATLTYTVVSGGSALMESMQTPAPDPDMVTIYHRDGADLVATHYCSMGNQPRMRAAGSTDGKSIRFRFADITNLAKPGAAHISHITVTFEDADHFTQEWIGSVDGKEQPPTVFKWTRVKQQ